MRGETTSSFHFRTFTIARCLALGALCVHLGCSSADPDDGGPGVAGAPSGGGGSTGVAGANVAGKPAAGAPAGGSAGAPTFGGQAGANVGGSLAVSGQGGGGAAGQGPGPGGGAGAGGKMDGGKAGSGGIGGSSSGGAGGASGGSGGSAAGGAPGGSGGSSTAGFNPCPPAGTACKILPLGDSITDGIGFSGGYRVELFRLARADGKTITYLGGSMNGPNMVDGVMFPKNHEGHSGWTIDQIDGIVPTPALSTIPHIILLHIGTNDMYQTPSGAPDRLGKLLDQIVMAAPEALLVVAKIIPLPNSSAQVMTFNNAVPGVVMTRAQAGKHVILVDQFMGFPASELGDGVHPNQMGYARMAKVWYDAIKTYLH